MGVISPQANTPTISNHRSAYGIIGETVLLCVGGKWIKMEKKQKKLPVGFTDISNRVRATLAGRYHTFLSEDGTEEHLKFSEGQQIAIKHILDHVVKYRGAYLTCFSDNKPILENDLETTIDACAMNTKALSRPMIRHVLLTAPMSFQRYQYLPAFPRFLKVDGATTYNTWHPIQRLRLTDTQHERWVDQQHLAKQWASEWLEVGLNKHLVYEDFIQSTTPLVWKIMMKMLIGNEHSTVKSQTFKEDQKVFTQWFACCVHRPLERVRWAPIIRGAHGIGKGTFQHLAKALMGPNSVSVVNNLTGITKQFAGERALTRLLVVDECYSKGDVAMETFKPIVTDDMIPVERKGEQLFTTRATHNTIIFSNHYRPFKSAETERRWWVPPYRDYDLGPYVSKDDNQAFHAKGNKLIRAMLPTTKSGEQTHIQELLSWLKLVADNCPQDFFSVSPKSEGFVDLVDMSVEEEHDDLVAWISNLKEHEAISLPKLVATSGIPQSKLVPMLKAKGLRNCQMASEGNRKVWSKAPKGTSPRHLVDCKLAFNG